MPVMAGGGPSTRCNLPIERVPVIGRPVDHHRVSHDLADLITATVERARVHVELDCGHGGRQSGACQRGGVLITTVWYKLNGGVRHDDELTATLQHCSMMAEVEQSWLSSGSTTMATRTGQ